jgi:hypothetical protein
MSRFKSKLTYANAMATVAVFVVLGGGAYAAATVGTNDIQNGAVTPKKLSATAKQRWAVVHHNGTLQRGRGAADAAKIGASDFAYSVVFKRDVSECSYAVTPTEITGGDEIGIASASPNGDDPNAVVVVTRDEDGVGDPRSFSLQVSC